LGFIAPLIVMVIVYYLQSSHDSFGEYLKSFFLSRQMITFWGAWCLVGNIALFTFYINTNRFKTAKGIFAVTLLYGVGVLLLKVLI
jgi:hypothetical protein